jgi:uncharacterized protein HemX
MSIRPWRAASTDLARIKLVLSQGRARRGWIVWCALAVAALLAGAGVSELYWRQRLAPLQQQVAAMKDQQQLLEALEQSRLQMRVSEARSEELERQIGVLNRQLRECQQEFTFFRSTGSGKHQ